MEKYHVGNTGPPVDFLLKRAGAVIDPTGATSISAEVRIKGQDTVKFTSILATVTDADGVIYARLSFAAGNLDTVGIYQVLPKITWPSNTESSPDPYEFEVVEAWS